MATIYDVAKAAGVSPKTVSRVLNRDAPVSESTRRVVEAAMERLAYVPSNAARTMRSNRTGLVGLVTGAISGSPTGGEPSGLPELHIVQGIQHALSEGGITLLISDTGGRHGRVPELVNSLRRHRIEGLIFVADRHREIRLPDGMPSDPTLLVNCFDDADTPAVLPDDAHGQETLTAALIAHGHRRIGFLTLPETHIAARVRLQGYVRALTAAAIDYEPRLVAPVAADQMPDYAPSLSAALDRFLTLDAPPTVLLCGNDCMALAVYGHLRSRGIRVPEDMSVAGYDDYRVISETLFPQLTTMELPYAAMGARAGKAMLALLSGAEPEQMSAPTYVRGHLRWRASVLPAAPERQQQSQARRIV